MQPQIVTIVVRQLLIRCVCVWGDKSTMSGFDWRSEDAYPDAKETDTVDIAWEWLGRDDGRLPTAIGAVLSRLIRKRRSTNKRFSGRRRLCRRCCRSAGLSARSSPGGMTSTL